MNIIITCIGVRDEIVCKPCGPTRFIRQQGYRAALTNRRSTRNWSMKQVRSFMNVADSDSTEVTLFLMELKQRRGSLERHQIKG